jgi:hypothetical protein
MDLAAPFSQCIHTPFQPNLISNTRTIDEHNGWLISAFATVLLGSPAPWEHPEYLALRAGFNKAFGTVRFASVSPLLVLGRRPLLTNRLSVDFELLHF